MINGKVSPQLQAVIQLRLRGPLGTSTLHAMIDTGFNSSLIIPLSVIRQVGLSQLTNGIAEMADGATVSYEIFEAEVEWGTRSRHVLAGAMGDQCLIGMSFLRGCELRIDIKPGGEVVVTEASSP